MSSNMRQRLVAAWGANAFGQGVSILIQLASLPAFLMVWDMPTYGAWLLLSAIPSYLGMADLGMVATAGNRMTMAMGRGDAPSARVIFQSALAFMLAACVVLTGLSLALVYLLPVSWLATPMHRDTLALLILGVIVGLFSGIVDTVFRATGRYALGTALSNGVRLAEWLAALFALFTWGSMISLAACMLAARLLGLLWSMRLASGVSSDLGWSIRLASSQEVRAMLHPALSFMAFPLANALTFQGCTLLVGHLMGPAAVAVFNTCRTLARVAVQATGVFGHALWVEFARLYGQGGGQAVAPLYRRAMGLGLGMSVALSVVLYLIGPWLLAAWTHHRMTWQPALLAILLAYAAVGGIWHVPRVLLLSCNQHTGLARWSLLAAVACLLLAWALMPQLNLVGMAWAMFISEAGIALACLRQARRLTMTEPHSPTSLQAA